MKRQVNSPLHPSACTVDLSHIFSFFTLYPYYSPSFSRSMSFSVILCFPNDYNNEALSSASTTDAQNIWSLNLSLYLCLSCCLISTFSASLIVILFSYQTSHSSANWNLITSHKHLFQSVCSDFHKFLEVQSTVCFVHYKKVLLVLMMKILHNHSTFLSLFTKNEGVVLGSCVISNSILSILSVSPSV